MNLALDRGVAAGYKSPAQIARVVSENWARENLYCACCSADRLVQTKAGTPATDFVCNACDSRYELKSSRRWSSTRIPGAAYKTMIAAIASDSRPNLLVMQYSQDWKVSNLLLVPAFFLTASMIDEREPLGATARRSRWIGCNIRIDRVPAEGRIVMVQEGHAVSEDRVRQAFRFVRPVSRIGLDRRGWLLDVWRAIESLNKQRFSLQDAYETAGTLKCFHPGNRNIKPKIRQQLQVLRKMGLLRFLEPGRYELVSFGPF